MISYCAVNLSERNNSLIYPFFQVINAARILASRPKSKVAQDNLDVFRDAWINQVRILTDAVDDIITIDDFLGVSENHILDDVNNCVATMQVKTLD